MRTTPQGVAALTGAPVISTAAVANGVQAADFDIMQGSTDTVHAAADLIHQQLLNLRTALEGMSSSWDGLAKSAFYTAIGEWQPVADALRDELYYVGDKLGSAHKSLSAMEQDNMLALKNAGPRV